MASGLTEFSLRRRITVLVLLMSIVVVGFVATVGIPVELFPRGFTDQSLFVWVPWQNAPTQEVLDKITLPLEEELSTVHGLDRINSFSTARLLPRFLADSSRAPTWTSPTARCATGPSARGCSFPRTWTACSSARTTPPGFPCASSVWRSIPASPTATTSSSARCCSGWNGSTAWRTSPPTGWRRRRSSSNWTAKRPKATA